MMNREIAWSSRFRGIPRNDISSGHHATSRGEQKMKNKILSTAILVMAVINMAAMAMAQEPQVIHFQGLLTGPGGGPLRTDIYQVNFSIWDHATDGFEALWSEQRTVEVTDGLFDVFLGDGNPLDPDVFTPDEGESELRYLQIQVEGDDPMTPRTQIAKIPNSFVSSRVLGDIETLPGLLEIHPPNPCVPPDPCIPAIQMSADDIMNNISINWDEALDVPSPAIEMAVNHASGEASFRLTEPLDIPAPAIEMSTDGSANSIVVNWTQPLDIPNPAIEMMANGIDNSFAINWAEPLDIPSPAIEMNANDVANNIILNWTEPLDMPSPAIEMSTAPTTGATYRMFQPQPEPPCNTLLQMNTHSAGANFAMAAPSYGGLRTDIETPIIEMATGIESGGSIKMFQPQPEPPGSDPIIEMLVGASGGNFSMYGQQARLTSTPFFEINSYSTGADLKFFDSAEAIAVEINSGGDVIAKRGTFGLNNTNNGTAGFVCGGDNSLYAPYSAIVGGYNNTVATAAEYSCLVGIDATLSADSTFMVDMPHIHFGDETDGYEFPTEDGRPNQFLATDGNGQLSWVDVTLLADDNTRLLIDENKELKNVITELERRIEELEKKTR
jgi:hypothetical protein